VTAIETRGLTHHYGSLCAVDHLDLTIARGECFAFLGPNGAGKTTTIRLLTGLLRPQEGMAMVDGLDVSREPLAVKARIGVVPERSNLYAELSARENLVFVGQLYGLARRESHARADELLAQFSLSDRAATPFAALSGGLKRRLTIAAALVHRPSILFLDEPTTGLDVQSARNLRTLIQKLHQGGITVFLTTHLLNEVEQLADRVGILVQGRLVAVDTPAALCASCQEDTALEVMLTPWSDLLGQTLEGSPHIKALSRSGAKLRLTVTSLGDALADVLAAAHAHGAEIEAVRSLAPTLEDAFVRLTGIDVAALQHNKPSNQGGSRG
jgi:ABC-2 type transport system ATP-binding protein